MATYVEAPIDGLSKPDVFLLLGLAGPPVLLGDAGRVGVDAGLTSVHVTENFNGIQGAALVRVDPVVTCRVGDTQTLELRAQKGGKAAAGLCSG